MLITKSVKVKWNPSTKEWYESKGYIFTKYGDELEIKTEELMNGSRELVKVQCDNKFCNNEKSISYHTYYENINGNSDGKYYCNSCSRILGRNQDKKGNLITLNDKNERICNVANCNTKHEAKGHCRKHYDQFEKYGHILERTYRDRNIIIIKDDYAEIILQNIKCEEVGRAYIDLDVIEKCEPYSWHLCKNGYVTAFINDKQIYLHRFIMNITDPKIQVDHMNRNRCDDRKVNLRFCSNAENGKNKRILDANTSGTTGVRYDKRRDYWYASIRTNRKDHYLGSSPTREGAVELREMGEIKYFGEFSPHYEEFIKKYPTYYQELLAENNIYSKTYM